MDKIERLNFIRDNNEYNRILYNLRYLSPTLFRDLDIVNDYFTLIEQGNRKMKVYEDLAKLNGLQSRQVREIIKRFSNEV